MEAQQTTTALASPPPAKQRWRPSLRPLEPVVIPLLAAAASLVVFGLFLGCSKVNPFTTYRLMFRGAFGTWFSWQDTLVRASPLLLTGLCTALPLRLGMVNIGGEGAVVMGGLVAAGMAHLVLGASPWLVIASMAIAGAATGAIWIGISTALKLFRGVNETISSLLLNYIGIAILNHMVEGPWHDPASLNNPSTWPIGDENMIGTIPGMGDVHWGFAVGIAACVACWVLMEHTTLGFSARVIGGNARAARIAGLPIGAIALLIACIGGACGGLAGMIEVGAIHGHANAALVANYGYTGILVAFIARGNPLAIIPVAIILGGINASNGLLQREQNLPDATVQVFQGILFLMILASESFYGRLKIFKPTVEHV